MQTEHFDVLILGAGISGIGAACHLERKSPGKTYAILERRQNVGGTWDLFRYPGIRSDSDMFTFGFNFRPWTDSKVLADGASIKGYLRQTAEQYGVDRHIRFGTKVTAASWSSEEQRWTVTAETEPGGKVQVLSCSFLIGATGYYNYDTPYRPEFPGEKNFKGPIIHPQQWPENLDYAGKRVVVIGSGATAITLVPSMAGKAAHVTMLQRSPTYIMTVPAIDPLSPKLRRFLPEMAVYRITRARNVGLQRMLYQASRRAPKAVKRLLLAQVKAQLGGKVDMKHFTPSYNPWDERLCVVPNGDLFKALKKGSASIVTDQIDSFTAKGIKLKSGEELQADIIITATGLNVQLLGGVQVDVDGERFKPKEHMTYKGVLVEGVPNAAIIIGYTNASWTLKADIASEYICRVINHMDKNGYGAVVPQAEGETPVENETVMGGLSSGYIQRAADNLPRQGSKRPWKVVHDYVRDVPVLRYSQLEDGILQFSAKVAGVAAKPKKATRKSQAA